MTTDDTLQAALRRLRAEYLAAAPERVAELWTAYAGVQNGSGEALEGLHTLAHRLAGSGGSYGFPDITARARDAGQICRLLIASRAPPSPDELEPLRLALQGIADAFHNASTSE